MHYKIFNNTKCAFALKSKADLKKAIFLFKMISRPFMVSVGTWLTMASLKMGLPVKGIIKKTIFHQFCGGESMEDCLPVVKKMYEFKAYTVLDHSVEGKKSEEDFDLDLKHKMAIVEFAAKHDEIPFAVFKPTGMGHFETYEKVSADKDLTADEQRAWDNIQERVETLCQKTYDLGQRIQVDAEHSWMQTAADDLIERMMEKFNKERVVVYNTVQCYRWDRLQYVKDLHQRAEKKGFKVGLKIVRGAYMEVENSRAKKKGYPTPICEDKEATDVNFNAVLNYILQHLDDMSIYIGTHNEVSSYLAMQLIDEKELDKNDDRIWFSQLYGMSDHITFNLAMNGYNAAKLMPFGEVDEVIPYLIRRARENSSVKGQTGRELALLKEEQQRRGGEYKKRVS